MDFSRNPVPVYSVFIFQNVEPFLRRLQFLRQFMGGSEESPVSTAWMYGVISSKHSSTVSNPENAPNREKWGVQICAGT